MMTLDGIQIPHARKSYEGSALNSFMQLSDFSYHIVD
jgi:hypothetical protein